MDKKAYELGKVAALIDCDLLPRDMFEKVAYNILWNPAWKQDDPDRARLANLGASGAMLAGGLGGAGLSHLATNKLLRSNPRLRSLTTLLSGVGAGLGAGQAAGSAIQGD